MNSCSWPINPLRLLYVCVICTYMDPLTYNAITIKYMLCYHITVHLPDTRICNLCNSICNFRRHDCGQLTVYKNPLRSVPEADFANWWATTFAMLQAKAILYLIASICDVSLIFSKSFSTSGSFVSSEAKVFHLNDPSHADFIFGEFYSFLHRQFLIK